MACRWKISVDFFFVQDVNAAREAPSIEPIPQSGTGQSDRCEPSPKVDRVADLLGTVDKPDSYMCDPTLQPTAAEDGRTQVDPISQDVVQAKHVARPADGDAHLPVVQSGITNDSRAVAETVAMRESTISEVANSIPPTDESPGTITQPRVNKQPSREFSASAAAEAVQYDDAADVQDRVGTEMPAQLQDAAPFVGGVKDVAEAEIHTPARDGPVVVEETPDPEVEVDAQGQQILEDDDAMPEPAPTPAVLEPAVEEASSVALAVETSSGEIVEGAQDVPPQAENAADQVSKFASQEQAAAIDIMEPLVEAPAPRVLVEDEPRVIDHEIGVPTPVVETAALVDETPGPQTATEEYAPIQLPTIVLKSETPGPADEVVDEAIEPLAEEAQASIEAAPSAQILTGGSLPEGAITLTTARDTAQTNRCPEAPRAAERLPLQEDDDEEDVPEITVIPVDVGAEPIVEVSARDPVVDGSVEDGSGGEPEMVGDESEVVEVSLPVPVATEASSAVVGVLEDVLGESDRTDGIAGDVDVAAEQLVTCEW